MRPGKGAAVLKARGGRGQRGPPSDPPPPLPSARRANGSSRSRSAAWIQFTRWASDGLLRTLRVSDGVTIEPPVPFLPPNARPSSLVFVDGFVYTTTTNGAARPRTPCGRSTRCRRRRRSCGGTTGGANIARHHRPDARDRRDPRTSRSCRMSRRRARRRADRRWTCHANAIVALDRNTLAVKDWFAPSTRARSTRRQSSFGTRRA